MANIVVDQAKLVLNTFATIFQNNLLTADLVTWHKHDKDMNDRNGLTVVEQIGPRYMTHRTTNGVANLAAGVQDSVFGSEQYRLEDTFSSSMGYGDWQKIKDFESARENEALKNSAINMAEQIDAYLLNFATLASNNWLGTPGAAVQDFDDIAGGYTRLKEEGVEDADIRAVLTYGDKQALGSQIVTDNASLANIGDGIFRQGFAGTVAGIPTMFTQQLPTMRTGTRTNGTMGGANQNVDYKSVSRSAAPGQYLSQTISVAGLGANATIKDGEVFTIAGVYAYDNRVQAPLTHLQQFRVIGDYTATAGGAVTNLRVFPALVVPGTGTGTDINVNKANATVDSIPAAAAVITWMSAANTLIRPRLLINKQAISVHTADLPTPATGTITRKSLTKIPVSVRMWRDSVFETGEHRIRFDVALTANVTDRRRLVRING